MFCLLTLWISGESKQIYIWICRSFWVDF